MWKMLWFIVDDIFYHIWEKIKWNNRRREHMKIWYWLSVWLVGWTRWGQGEGKGIKWELFCFVLRETIRKSKRLQAINCSNQCEFFSMRMITDFWFIDLFVDGTNGLNFFFRLVDKLCYKRKENSDNKVLCSLYDL